MSAAGKILKDFETISLEGMESVKLMDRTDTKYMFGALCLPLLLEKIRGHYWVLSIEGKTESAYRTLYFDTGEHDIYLKHHNGNLNRCKIRYRNYADSNAGFLEVKFKNNKGRTVKERIKQKEVPLHWDERSFDFISAKTPYDPRQLRPVLWVRYKRITLVSKNFTERVTIDVDIEFANVSEERKMGNLVIAEIKQGNKAVSQVAGALREMRLKPASLSKYCLGMASIYPQLKRNNFKQKLTLLNKIINNDSFKLASGF